MSEQALLWILGVFVTLAIADVVAYVALKDKISTDNILIAQRVSRLEAIMEMLGEKSAQILHKDDDEYQIDDLLDKYLDAKYELSTEEWNSLMLKCERIEKDKTLPMGSRLAAAMLNAICHNKLMLSPEYERWWQKDEQR